MTSRELETQKRYFERSHYLLKKAYSEATEKKHPVTKQKIHAYKDNKGEQYVGLSLYNTCVWFKMFWGPNLLPATVRLYRASLMFYAELELKSQKIDQFAYDKIKELLSSIKGGDRKNIELRTSAKKQKHLSIKDFKFLDDALKESKNKWAKPTRIWLQAGIISGLRPIEWKEAAYDERNNCLVIKNAKNTNGRAHGMHRTFYLDHISDYEKKILLQHLKTANSLASAGDDNIWKTYYEGCSNLLKYTCDKIWPNRERHPTLYSARHQFSANLKASGCKPEELAVLMGHAVDDTALTTYGKKVNGTRGIKPKINSEEIKRVKKSKKSYTFTLDNITKNKNK